MEATQPDPTAGSDQQQQIDAALDTLSTAVAAVKTRVQSELAGLRDQLQQAHDSHASLDLTVVIQRVTQIEQDILAIDPQEATVGDPAPQEGAPPADATQPPDLPEEPTPGDQG